MLKSYGITFILMLVLLGLAACDSADTPVVPVIPDTYEVDPVFREFYDTLGGQDLLGPAISQLFFFGDVKYQYTVTGLMVNDPSAPSHQRMRFAALGLDMNITEPAIPQPSQADGRYVDGHVIPNYFLPLYERLGGARYVGRPLTEVHFNPEKHRYEQYFENLGIYWIEGEPAEDIGLLAYGAWRCDSSCRQPDLGSGGVILPYRTSKHFEEIVRRLGAEFTGFAISEAYQTPDGFIEQVFENLVLVMDPHKPGRVFPRAITERLGMRQDPLVEPNGLPGSVFYEVQAGRGYNIPQHFLDYLALHGGQEVAGAPIGERVRVKDNINRQCFKNMCLEEHYAINGAMTIRPTPLGYTYRRLSVVALQTPVHEDAYPAVKQPESEAAPNAGNGQAQPPVVSEISLQVWESFPLVASDQSQEIGVVVYENNTPLPNIEPDLIVTFPDGSAHTYYMAPTGMDGQTRLTLEPVGAINGSIIQYQVCIYSLPNHTKLCARDSFLIWQN